MDKKEFFMKNLLTLFRGKNHWICVVVLVLVCTGAVFAQDKKNAIAFDGFHLFRGFIASDSDADTFFFCIASSFERQVAPRYTVGAELDMFFGNVYDVGYMYLGMGVNSRFYPMSENMDKLFLGASLGFNMQFVDGKAKTENGGFVGPYIALRTGYKLPLNDTIFVEPSMSYTYSKSNEFTYGMTPQNMGWQAALRIGFSF